MKSIYFFLFEMQMDNFDKDSFVNLEDDNDPSFSDIESKDGSKSESN